MRPRLSFLVGVAVSVVACASDVTCPRGAAENDAGYCVDLPTDSSVSAATDDDDARSPRDPDASQIDAGYESDGSAYNDAADQARDAGEVANDAGDPATRRDAEPVGLDGSPDDAASPTVDAGPACVPSTEVCNGKDDDCDQQVDEDVSEAPIGTACTNGGQGVCSVPGKHVCSAGTIICNAPPPMPSPELCDGVDNDCNSKVDEAFADKGKACTAGTGDCAVPGMNECDPADPTKLRCAAVAKAKTCGDSCAPQPTSECSAGSGDCKAAAAWLCDSASSTWRCPAVAKPVTCAATGSCSPLPAENCGDGVDNDCDGTVDDGCIACGDRVLSGTEACDPTAPGWSAWTCTGQCQIQRSYTTCSSDQGCAGGRCLGGICTRICNSTGECPAPGSSAAVVKPYCDSTLTVFVDSAWRSICGLAYCSSSDECPPHQDCAQQNPDLPTQPRLCAPRICTADSVCGPGLKCSANVCVEP
jgi:Putative metal-binding motif